MTAPTPVSALLHAATLVIAGMFLLLKSAILLAHSYQFDQLIFSIGAFTALLAGIAAVFQSDIKKLVAYSTTSQLGYICLGCALGSSSHAVFHLFTHAFFKGLIFLSSGAVIHSVDSELNVYKLSALIRLITAAHALMISGSLALVGIPFLAGFYSKELIVISGFASYL
jgi:NADH-quinone oxidoreductase subunit L